MSSRRALLRATCLTGCVIAFTVAITASPALAGEAVGGRALIAKPDSTTPLRAGGSATKYGLSLPDSAGCPGDTQHKAFHVFTYLVPKGHLPTEVSFKTGVPSRWFGYIANGAYYGAINTMPDTGKFQTIPDDFTWTRLTPADLFGRGRSTATWEGGIACANGDGVVTDYWNTEVVFTATSSDPGGFVWRVPDDTLGSSGRWWVKAALVIAALAALTAVALLIQGRRTSGRDRVVV